MAPFFDRLVEPRVSQTMARVGNQDVDWTISCSIEQLANSVFRRQVALDRLNFSAHILERRTGVDERRIGGNQQVIAVPRRKLGDFEADTARRAGDDGEFTLAHERTP